MPRTAWLLLSLLALTPSLAAAQEKKPPNIVILFADDLGYGDLACYGHPSIRTPELDRMAAEGMRFTQFYSGHPYCTPSRAALLTSRLPIRSGLNVVLNPKSQGGIQPDEVTLAEALKAKGYATACVGKWHLGHLEQYRPTRHGFDRYYGLLYSNDMTPVGLYRDDKEIENPVQQATLTERYTEEAIGFIKEATGKDSKGPFFLYLPYTMPHVPLFASKAFAGKSARGLYGDVIEELDASVGRVLKALRDAGVADNTLVVFTSDNGPWTTKGVNGGSAGLLREGKGTTWEGGMRVPGIAWWPGKIKAGAVSHDLVSVMDLFPTCVTLAGGTVPSDRPIDGKDLAPLLFGTGKAPRDHLFYYLRDELMAVRQGPWKLHIKTASHGDGNKLVQEVRDPPLLYHLERDPSEKHDVSKDHAEVVTDLRKLIERHKAEVKPGTPQK